MKVAVVDYGLGNIYSVMAALHEIGISAVIDTDGSKIPKCDTALVPGVAAFGAGIRNLHETGQADALKIHYSSGNKLVGLCLGAQMFMTASEESPDCPGLGFISGNVVRMDEEKCMVPNQGWMRVSEVGASRNRTLNSKSGESYYYFSHSYRMAIGSGISVLGISTCGQEQIVAVYSFENTLGIQFHPERSGPHGLAFLSAALTS